jgi:predicted ATP-grasp superfamily ATP-dependent carboligase
MTATASQTGALILGGAHGSLEIARSLGRRGIPVWLVTSDNPLPTLSRYVARNFSWPGPDWCGAVNYLAELAERHGLKGWVLFAGGDAEVQFIAQNHKALGALFTLTTPAWDTTRFAIDKRAMNARAAELGLAAPRSHYPRSRDDLANLNLRFPVVIKPSTCEARSAFGKAKAWRADDAETLLARYDKVEAVAGADRIMVQELIPGDGRTQFSYAAVWQDGTPVGSLVAQRCRQYPVDFGFTSTFVETIAQGDIEDAACRFLTSLDYSGLVEIEFKYDARDGAYKMLDVNTRTWTWISLGAAAGVDFAALAWRLARGERVEPVTGKTGVTWRYLSRDLVAATQEMLVGADGPVDGPALLRGTAASAVFAWDDPLPALLDLPLVAARVARRRLRRVERGLAVTPQSARSGS